MVNGVIIPCEYKQRYTMEEIQYVLANKIAQLNEKFENKGAQYNDDYKARILYDIETIIQDFYTSCDYTYTVFKFDTDTALFEVKDTLYSLVIVVLFRNRRAQVCFSGYSNY